MAYVIAEPCIGRRLLALTLARWIAFTPRRIPTSTGQRRCYIDPVE